MSPKTISKFDDEAKRHAVWVETEWQERGMFGHQVKQTAKGCVRYFPSSKAGGADTALLFPHGVGYSHDDPNQYRNSYEKTAKYKGSSCPSRTDV